MSARITGRTLIRQRVGLVAAMALVIVALVACGRAGTGQVSAATATRVTDGPCGFPDCSHIPHRSGAIASCDGSTFENLVSDQIDGGIDISGSGCDGNYLVLDLSHRTCAGSGPACNTPLNLAYFVAVDGSWRLITYGVPCAMVTTKMEPGLPAALCAKVSHEG